MKGHVRKREYFNSHPWRGWFLGMYRDFETQPEAVAWVVKKRREYLSQSTSSLGADSGWTKPRYVRD